MTPLRRSWSTPARSPLAGAPRRQLPQARPAARWPATRSCSWSRSAACFATILFFKDLGDATTKANVFAGLVAAWLWFTVLFANFAEAMAEGRGKAQADTLRKTRAETTARRRLADGTIEELPSSQLDVGDLVVVTAGEVIPGDGDVIEGIASVDESAITGESAPVIRESGGDRSAVTGGTRVLSDEIVVRITARAGRDVPRPHDRARRGRRAGRRRRTRSRSTSCSPGLTIIFLLATVTLQPFADLLRRRAARDRARSRCSSASSRRRSARCSPRSASPAWTASCSATCSR